MIHYIQDKAICSYDHIFTYSQDKNGDTLLTAWHYGIILLSIMITGYKLCCELKRRNYRRRWKIEIPGATSCYILD